MSMCVSSSLVCLVLQNIKSYAKYKKLLLHYQTLLTQLFPSDVCGHLMSCFFLFQLISLGRHSWLQLWNSLPCVIRCCHTVLVVCTPFNGISKTICWDSEAVLTWNHQHLCSLRVIWAIQILCYWCFVVVSLVICTVRLIVNVLSLAGSTDLYWFLLLWWSGHCSIQHSYLQRVHRTWTKPLW